MNDIQQRARTAADLLRSEKAIGDAMALPTGETVRKIMIKLVAPAKHAADDTPGFAAITGQL